MSKPAAGNYQIYNRVLGPNGEKLALTFSGKLGDSVTATPLTTDKKDNQTWILKDYNSKTSSISPVKAPGDQITGGSGGVPAVFPANNYVWTIKYTNTTGYTIQNGAADASTFWATEIESPKVSIGKDTGEHARWVFVKV